MKKKINVLNKKGISYFEIILLILSVIAFSYIISDSVKAEITYCCEKTKKGAWCQNAPKEECDENYASTPTSCEATAYCKLGCCYDSQEGICMENTPEKVCEMRNGTWNEDASCNIPQCQLGCCVLNGQAAFVTLTRCKKLSSFYGLETDFRKNIGSETQCLALASLQDKGACVYEVDYVKTCKFTTRQECNSIKEGMQEKNGTITGEVKFYKDYLCSAEELGTNCGPTEKTTCKDGKVYFVDSCGNVANIYDASKINDKSYWRKVVKVEDSCGYGKSNVESKECGNCDYLLGSRCGKATSVKPRYGDYICRDLNCKINGKTYRHGESWCSTDKYENSVGSRYYRHICMDGEEIIEPCSDFRNEICIEDTIKTNGVEFKQAACRVNRWHDCIAQTTKEDCENIDKRDCKWIGGKGKIKCVPEYAPGFKFWEDEANEICSQASTTCVVTYEKGLIGGKKCKENCHCLTESWKKQQEEICHSLGDCGGKINYIGVKGGEKKSTSLLSSKIILPLAYVIKVIYSGMELVSGNHFGFESGEDKPRCEDYCKEKGYDGGYCSFVGCGYEDKSYPGNETNCKTDYCCCWKIKKQEEQNNLPTTTPIPTTPKTSGQEGAAKQETKTKQESSGKEEKTYEKKNETGIKPSKQIPINRTGPLTNETGLETVNFLGLFKLHLKREAAAIVRGFSYSLAVLGTVQMLGSLFGLSKEVKNALSYGATAGIMTTQIIKGFAPKESAIYKKAGLIGVGVGLLVFLLTYKKEKKEIVKFDCYAWEAPRGGNNCEKCNEGVGCSEYRCRSLGQACQLLNKGTNNEKCAWVNPHDVTSPKIETWQDPLNKDYAYEPDSTIRPPARGVKIINKKSSDGCIKAFTPLTFGITTDEPAQCKIDYKHTTNYSEMKFYMGNTNLFIYNHTQTLSLPGPDHLKDIEPTLQHDGTYSFYIRCIDANGNYNHDEFVIRFCVEKGPDVQAPIIVSSDPLNGVAVQYNLSQIEIKIYTNEPAECRWSRVDQSFDTMENSFICLNKVWEMNNEQVYECRTNLTGLQNRRENIYYFRCKDQPWLGNSSDRNVNTESYKYILRGTIPLNIIKVGPNGTIKGAADVIPVMLTVETSNGANNGDAWCYYSNDNSSWVKMYETGTNKHSQRQDLSAGNYTYYFKCVDEGGNVDYASTTFNIYVDRDAPKIVRVYQDEGKLKIITDEESNCVYQTNPSIGCNYKIEEGIVMPYVNTTEHFAEWEEGKTYYIKCEDENGNMPIPNTECSIIVSTRSQGI